jgi:hypothetical protein
MGGGAQPLGDATVTTQSLLPLRGKWPEGPKGVVGLDASAPLTPIPASRDFPHEREESQIWRPHA